MKNQCCKNNTPVGSFQDFQVDFIFSENVYCWATHCPSRKEVYVVPLVIKLKFASQNTFLQVGFGQSKFN